MEEEIRAGYSQAFSCGRPGKAVQMGWSVIIDQQEHNPGLANSRGVSFFCGVHRDIWTHTERQLVWVAPEDSSDYGLSCFGNRT